MPRGKSSHVRRRSGKRRYWSAGVMQRSNALDLKAGVFRSNSPRQIAASLKRSAEHSKRRKSTSYQSAMSMLNFYINRAGKTLSAHRIGILERAKPELRKLFRHSRAQGQAA